MADQSSSSSSSVNLQKNIAIGLSKSSADEGNNKLGFSGHRDSLKLNKKNSTRILGSEMTDINQDHKRRCFEDLVVRRERMMQQNGEDAKCALEVEVIDDTALIEATAAGKRFKNRYHRNESDLGFGKNSGNAGGLRNSKEEGDDKKRRNKGFKKEGTGCLMKCVNEKKLKKVEDKSTSKKQISEGKGHKAYRKMSGTVKYVYQKKDPKNPNSVVTGVEEHQKVEDQNAVETIVGGAVQEIEVSLNDSVGNETESTIKLVETETVSEKDDGVKLNPQNDVLVNTETEDQNESANTNVAAKKTAYTMVEMEALRFVDEAGQKAKWAEVCNGFGSSVAREYAGLVFDVSSRPPRYNRVVNCGYTRHMNPILSMPPVLPLCSPSSHRKFDRTGVTVSFN